MSEPRCAEEGVRPTRSLFVEGSRIAGKGGCQNQMGSRKGRNGEAARVARGLVVVAGLLVGSSPVIAQPGGADADAGVAPVAMDAGAAPPADLGAADLGAADPVTDAGAASASGGAADAGVGTGTDADAGAGSSTGTVISVPVDVMAPEVRASASPTLVSLGGRFTVFVEATFSSGVEVNLREPLDLGPAFEVRAKLSEDRVGVDGRRTREWQLDVLAWELGELQVPPIAVTFTAFGRVGQVQTNPLRLRVEGVLGEVVDDPNAMRGLHPPAELVARDWFWLWVAAGAAGALGVLAGALWWRARRRRRTVRLTGGVVAVTGRLDMTGERALEALLAIERSGVLERAAERKRAYAEMVDVIRGYLGARYHVATRDLTTSELVRQLAGVAPAVERELVESWLSRCDLVKYGGVVATSAEAKAVLDDARALIVTTTQLRDGGEAA